MTPSFSANAPPTGYPRAPKMIRAGLVRIDQVSWRRIDVVVFQYNPDSLSRTLQPRAMAGEPGDRLEVLRLTGPPHETIKFDAEIDATDQLEHPDPDHPENDPVVSHGLLPALAVLERLITPTAAQLQAVDALYDQGTFEVAPVEAPLTVLVWGVRRVVPVLITSLSLTEEAFDPNLRPIRVKASFECKVLTSSDLPLQTGQPTGPPGAGNGGSLYIAHRQTMEQLGGRVTGNDVRPLGLEHLP